MSEGAPLPPELQSPCDDWLCMKCNPDVLLMEARVPLNSRESCTPTLHQNNVLIFLWLSIIHCASIIHMLKLDYDISSCFKEQFMSFYADINTYFFSAGPSLFLPTSSLSHTQSLSLHSVLKEQRCSDGVLWPLVSCRQQWLKLHVKMNTWTKIWRFSQGVHCIAFTRSRFVRSNWSTCRCMDNKHKHMTVLEHAGHEKESWTRKKCCILQRCNYLIFFSKCLKDTCMQWKSESTFPLNLDKWSLTICCNNVCC